MVANLVFLYSFVIDLDFWLQNCCYREVSQTKGYLHCYNAHQHTGYMNITTPLNNYFYSSFSFQNELNQNLNTEHTKVLAEVLNTEFHNNPYTVNYIVLMDRWTDIKKIEALLFATRQKNSM